MDLQETKKSSPSAHENQGVHVCRKCGWPFPKSHPSAKHRRAHKRVCGTVEGYKLLKSNSDVLHLSISDDERLSDDDQQTPSPKEIYKENVEEIGSSGGNALRSYRSEDDVFSDAVIEFSDSGVSPGLDEHKKSSKKLGADVHAALAINLTISEVPKDYETSAGLFPTQPGKSPLTLTMIHNSEVDRTESNLSRIPETDGKTVRKLPQSNEPGETDYLEDFNDSTGQKILATNSAQVSVEPDFNWENNKQEKEEPVTSVQVGNDLSNKVEPCTDSEYIKSQEASCAAQLESKSIETKQQSLESGTLDWMVSEIGTEISYPLTIVESYLVDRKPLTASAVTENVDEKDKELVSKSQLETFSPGGFIPIKEVDLGVDRNTGQLAERNELKKEGNVDTMTSVTESVSARGNIAVDLKDYKVFKSSIPSDMGDTDDADPEEYESILSSDLGTLKKSCLNLYDNGDETQKGVLPPVEMEVATSGSSVTHDQGCSETTSLLRDRDNQTLKDNQGSRLYLVDAKTLNHDDVTAGEYLDVINVPSIGEEIFQNTTLYEDTKNVGVEFEKTKEGEQVTNHTFELSPVVNSADHIDINHESVQQPTNSSESDGIKNANQVNISTSDLKSLADTSTYCKCSDEYKKSQDVTVPNEGDEKMAKHLGASLVDMSVTSSRRTDSLEGNWGSVSVVSSQSDVAAIVETGVLVVASDSHPIRKSVLISQNSAKECPNQNPVSLELGKEQDREPTTEPVEVGNGSEGRIKNDVIAKVTNWRDGKQHHSPLKNLLNEASEETYAAIPPPNELQQFSITDQTALKNAATAVTTVSSILGSEMSIDDHAAYKEKELDSPARYPTSIKKEKKKGRPYWVPFVCCSSMHHDI